MRDDWKVSIENNIPLICDPRKPLDNRHDKNTVNARVILDMCFEIYLVPSNGYWLN